VKDLLLRTAKEICNFTSELTEDMSRASAVSLEIHVTFSLEFYIQYS